MESVNNISTTEDEASNSDIIKYIENKLSTLPDQENKLTQLEVEDIYNKIGIKKDKNKEYNKKVFLAWFGQFRYNMDYTKYILDNFDNKKFLAIVKCMSDIETKLLRSCSINRNIIDWCILIKNFAHKVL